MSESAGQKNKCPVCLTIQDGAHTCKRAKAEYWKQKFETLYDVTSKSAMEKENRYLYDKCRALEARVSELEAKNQRLVEKLKEIQWYFDGESDIDGNGNPNRAMVVNNLIDEALENNKGE